MENYSALSHPYIFIDRQYAGMRNQKGYSPRALLGDCNNFIFFSKMILMLLQILQNKSFQKHMVLALFLLAYIVMDAEV